jgi:hypothetical protein
VDGLPADAMNATTRFSAAKVSAPRAAALRLDLRRGVCAGLEVGAYHGASVSSSLAVRRNTHQEAGGFWMGPQRTLLKPDLPHGPSSSVTGRRRLAAFDTAGTGGKKGVSCEYSAHMKAKQACAERQFLQRCEKESKTPKQKLTPWEQVWSPASSGCTRERTARGGIVAVQTANAHVARDARFWHTGTCYLLAGRRPMPRHACAAACDGRSAAGRAHVGVHSPAVHVAQRPRRLRFASCQCRDGLLDGATLIADAHKPFMI